MTLTERQERILAALVEDYVGTGKPTGSATILDRAPSLGVSSATVRSELAYLEDVGLVIALHTSGGRIPTTAGYKYYIENLLPARLIPDEDQLTIRHQFHQAHSELEEWLRLAAAVMAHRAHNVALVTTPRFDAVRLRRVELVEAQPHTVLIIVVLGDGSVLQEIMSVEDSFTRESLRDVADQTTRALEGVDGAAEMLRRASALPENVQPFASAVIGLVSRSAERRLRVYHQGLGEMLSRPEFSSSSHGNLAAGDKLRRVVDFLQQGLAMEDLLSLMASEEGVHVVIGGEAPLIDLADYSMVVGRYGGYPDGAGVLGVLGPSRMDYGRAISLVRYMTELMTDLIFAR